MQLRLAFAVAAHLEPEILIIDEVLAVGNSVFQQKCMDRMSDVSRDGRTLLFVSHNIPAIRRLCRSGIVLETGRKAFEGQAPEACIEYLSGGAQSARQGNRPCAPSAHRLRGRFAFR